MPNGITFDGKLVTTEQAVDSGNDGVVVASGIPSAASMAYDSKRNRLLIPMNDWNAIAIVDLQ